MRRRESTSSAGLSQRSCGADYIGESGKIYSVRRYFLLFTAVAMLLVGEVYVRRLRNELSLFGGNIVIY